LYRVELLVKYEPSYYAGKDTGSNEPSIDFEL